MTTLLEVKQDIYENDLREEGRIEGRIEGEKKGRKEKEAEIMFAMYKNGIPMNQIASIVRMDIEEIRKLIGE